MSDQTGTITTDQATEAATDPVAVAIRELQARVEDVAVRESRGRRWCDEFSAIMSAMFPEGPLDPEPCVECRRDGYLAMAWRDSDGEDCRGHRWYDADGYARDGFDVAGWNREGVNAAGERRDDPTRYRFNANGTDIDGYGVTGVNRWGRTRDQQERHQRYAMDTDGVWRDIDGYTHRGYDRDGIYSQSHDSDYWNN